jgi:hypothetical protein
LRAAICLLNHPDLPRAEVFDGQTIHKRREWNDIVPAGDEALCDLFRFTFVRHPLERFASFYRNKIGTVAPAATADRFVRMGLCGGMSLEEVVERVLTVPPAALDPHIAPQSLLVYDGETPRVDFIGRLERFADDLAFVQKKCGVTLDLGRLNATQPQGSASAAPRARVPDTIRARLEALYAEDFARFGYTP